MYNDNVYNACKYNKYKYIRTCLITYSFQI